MSIPTNCHHCNTKSIWRQMSSHPAANNEVIMTHGAQVQRVTSDVYGRSATPLYRVGCVVNALTRLFKFKCWTPWELTTNPLHWVVRYAKPHQRNNAKMCKHHFTHGKIMLWILLFASRLWYLLPSQVFREWKSGRSTKIRVNFM